ncbi:MAG TPA: hypothetical protein VFS40_14230 [Gemmatimonadales bacterium]|nr:hypothetical protein [Gemmatimonadales bacterium]
MRHLFDRPNAGIRLVGLLALSTALACASNSAGETNTAGYEGMGRDTLARDTTVIRDSSMTSDTVRMSRDTIHMNSVQRGGNLPDSEIRQRQADSATAVQTDSSRWSDSTSRSDTTRTPGSTSSTGSTGTTGTTSSPQR